MFIVNTDPTSGPIVHGEDTYAPDDGLYDVPEDLGRHLVNFPHWSEYDGTQPLAGQSAPAVAAEDLSVLPDGWQKGNKASLAALAEARGVDPSGNRNDLQGRLADWQVAQITG